MPFTYKEPSCKTAPFTKAEQRVILELRAEGKTAREITVALGLEMKKVQNFLQRQKMKQESPPIAEPAAPPVEEPPSEAPQPTREEVKDLEQAAPGNVDHIRHWMEFMRELDELTAKFWTPEHYIDHLDFKIDESNGISLDYEVEGTVSFRYTRTFPPIGQQEA